jgi:hypothetical protein
MLKTTRGHVLLNWKNVDALQTESGLYIPDQSGKKGYVDYQILALHPEDEKEYGLKKGDRVFVFPRFSVTGAPIGDIQLQYEKGMPFLVKLEQIAAVDTK